MKQLQEKTVRLNGKLSVESTDVKHYVEEIPSQSERLVELNNDINLQIEKLQSQMLVNHEQNAAYFVLQDMIVNGNCNAGSVEIWD